MKKNENDQRQNEQELEQQSTTTEKEQYDFSNLKMDLDEVLSLEQVSVSETLIQATLLRAKEAQRVEGFDEVTATKEEKGINLGKQEEQEEQREAPVEQIVSYKSNKKNKKYHMIQYGLLAASACILAIAGYSMINSLESKKDAAISMNNASVTTETASEESEAADLSEDATMDMTQEAEEDKSELTEGSDKSESATVSDDNNKGDDIDISSGDIEYVGELFTIDEGENTYQITEDQISQIIIYDEKGAAIQTISDTNLIQVLYQIFQSNSYTDDKTLENEEYSGQYVRQYAIIAENNASWSSLTIWITKNEKNQEIYTVRSQLLTAEEKMVTREMKGLTEVNMDNLLSCEEQDLN